MKRSIYNIKNYLQLAALSSLMLAGCSDDVIPGGSDTFDDSERGAIIYIPDVAGNIRKAPATRSISDLTDPRTEEKEIKKLYLFAYPVEGKGEKCVLSLPDDAEQLAAISTGELAGYTGYKLSIPDGVYHMYVVANVDFKDADIKSESMIEESALEIKDVDVPANATELTAKSLPMSCSNTQLWAKYANGSTYNKVTGDGIIVNSNNSVRIKANLTFAVAKVRVTLLNDIFPTKAVSSFKLYQLPQYANVFAESTKVQTLEEKGFCKSGYSSWGDIEMKDDPLEVEIDGLTLSDTKPANGWIWQGTAYVGERLFGEDATDKPTFELKYSDNGVTSQVLGDTEKEGLKRSYFYDYVGTPTTEFKLAVQQWTPEIIMGALHGEYFLHVDQTNISKVESGSPVAIWYDSNASLEFDFPKVTKNDADIEIYTAKVANDSIYLSLNSKLSSGDETIIGDRYKSFTIKAGTIEKKITVDEINLTEYLLLDKDSDEIDVRTIVSSGAYEGTTNVTVSTNLSKFSVEKVADTWRGVNGAIKMGKKEEPDYAVKEFTVGESGEVQVPITYSGLNSNSYWNNMHTVSFKIKGNVNGSDVEKTVNVNIIPATDDYTIYLYAPDWNNAHAYIYQCLKLPSTHSDYPNGPVGVYDNDNRAALEYNFSGGLAFRGWGVLGEDSKNHNNPKDALKQYEKFYVFTGEDNLSAGNWNMTDGDGLLNHYYFIDFYKQHRLDNCQSCLCKDVQRDYPGIRMQRVAANEEPGDGWWKITLTGIAKPGQTLLMFSDPDNNHGNISNRYPGDGKPGLPLFDYPNKIGYIDIKQANPQFSNEKPAPAPTIKITYTNPSNWNNVYLHYKLPDGTTNGWPGKLMTKSGEYWVGSVPANTSAIWFNHGSSDHQTADAGISTITERIYTDKCKNNHDCGEGGGVVSGDKVRLYVYDTDDKGQLRIWDGSVNANMNRDYTSPIPLYYYDVPKNTNVYVKWNGNDAGTACNISSTSYLNNTDFSVGKLHESTTSGTFRVFFKNENNWSNVYIYSWVKNSAGSGWPGNQAHNKGKYWFGDISNSHNMVIFNNNNDAQKTGDIDIEANTLYGPNGKINN